MVMRALVSLGLTVGVLLSLAIAPPVSAARPTSLYTISILSIPPDGSGTANLLVTRTGNFDNNPIVWVHNDCSDFSHVADIQVPWASTTATSAVVTITQGYTPCTAWVTTTPGHLKNNDPSVVIWQFYPPV